ncbi:MULTISPECIES: helix-turn-helix transcriptional regulator [Aeromonas]|uniref:helix-turn-helix transcriptional regulator n=1 Tax=Aeromonas TaxID=642 RepID=UPI00143E0C4A|nr:helix-turn-helix domain-containing protein [Aeromonas media]QIY88516.1 helix-turn-helix domain-containing protein [Aeromonas hydrophila]
MPKAPFSYRTLAAADSGALQPILKHKDLQRVLGCSRTTIYRWIESNKLPMPLRHNNGRIMGWTKQQIETLLATH